MSMLRALLSQQCQLLPRMGLQSNRLRLGSKSYAKQAETFADQAKSADNENQDDWQFVLFAAKQAAQPSPAFLVHLDGGIIRLPMLLLPP